MVIYLDTETTGLSPGQICQLSYIMQTKDNVKAKNMFFTVNYVSASAQAVHGFSASELLKLSNGKKFADYFEEIYNDFQSASLIVAHNTAFDIMFLRAEFEKLGKVLPDYNLFCSMKKSTPICKIARSSGGYKYPKLSELCAFWGVTDKDVNTQCANLFGKEVSFHDARFDCSALYLAINKGFNKADAYNLVKESI